MPTTSVSGTIAEIRTAVMDGNSYYFLRLEGSEMFYSICASEYPLVVILNVGDRVEISHEVAEGADSSEILTGYAISRK